MHDRVMRMNAQYDLTHWTGHVLSLLAVVTTMIGWVPSIAGVAGLVWYLVQIYESQTFQSWLTKRRQRKMARLQQRIVAIQQAEEARQRREQDDVSKIDPGF